MPAPAEWLRDAFSGRDELVGDAGAFTLTFEEPAAARGAKQRLEGLRDFREEEALGEDSD